MPLYCYSCPTHGTFEKIKTSFDESEPAVCPQCGEISAKVAGTPSKFQWNDPKRWNG